MPDVAYRSIAAIVAAHAADFGWVYNPPAGIALAAEDLSVTITETDPLNAGSFSDGDDEGNVTINSIALQHRNNTVGGEALYGEFAWSDSWSQNDAIDSVVIEAAFTIVSGMTESLGAFGIGFGSTLATAVFGIALRPSVGNWSACIAAKGEGLAAYDGKSTTTTPVKIRMVVTPGVVVSGGQTVAHVKVQLIDVSGNVISEYLREFTSLGTADWNKLYLIHHHTDASPAASQVDLVIKSAKVALS